MYAKIFGQIFDSSIAADYVVRHVFMDLLVLADRDGVVDMTLDAIARRTNVPDRIVSHAIEELMKPDERSRSHCEDGRRLILLDSHRNWGWQIVNYDHYRDIRDEEARKAYFRNYKRVYRSKDKLEPSESFLANRRRKGEIYYIFHNGLVKIGFSNNPQIRLQDLRVAAPNCVLIATEPGTPEKEFERHQQFATHRKEGEWFNISPEIEAHLNIISPSWKSTLVHNSSNRVQSVLDSPTLSTKAEAEAKVEEKAKTPPPKAPVFVLPDWISKDNWDGFVEMRRKKRVPNTERALGGIVRELDKLRACGTDPNASLDQSTMRGWTGVFEARSNGNGNHSKPKSQYEIEAEQQLQEYRERKKELGIQ